MKNLSFDLDSQYPEKCPFSQGQDFKNNYPVTAQAEIEKGRTSL